MVCTVYTKQKCAQVYIFSAHFHAFNKYTLLCAHFSSKSLDTPQQTAPYGPPLLAIQAARGPPNQAFPSLTVILQGGKSGLSAGPVFRVMACPEHSAFRAHMEPILSHETDSGRENVRLGPGNWPAALTRPMRRWGDRWFVIREHSATCVSAPLHSVHMMCTVCTHSIHNAQVCT